MIQTAGTKNTDHNILWSVESIVSPRHKYTTASMRGLVVAIGPQTARDVEDSGLKVSSVATDHSLSGVVAAIIRAFAAS
jgi:uroporphyrinogen-III synthase